jgi:alkylated DNA repair dioxygenase AlkB
MDAFISRKRRRSSPVQRPVDEDPTDLKLALLLSLFPDMTQGALLDVLTASDGSVEVASSTISAQQTSTSTPSPTKQRITAPASHSPKVQTSLSAHIQPTNRSGTNSTRKPLTRKGRTLHLYSPDDIAAHTPCTIIHNVLPPEQANALLLELLDESKHFSRRKFQLFDRTVQSPHSHSIYVSTPEEHRQQTSEYKYGGTYRSDVRQITPHMRAVSGKVQEKVNAEIRAHIRERYPGGQKLRFQSPREWKPNAAFANCYDGPAESVGFHSDELTYLGPRPVIGSLSLGVEREFRVRRVVPGDDEDDDRGEGETQMKPSDAQGQIAIHLPHNSLLVMHAEMQEEWKHALTPAPSISPHPLSGNRRINITYRWYRESLYPRYTPRCHCGSHAILRCVQRKRETRGRYMWMCYAGYAPGKKSCSFFQWAEFDDDGEPIWEKKVNADAAPSLCNFVETSR